ncbi:hypothetical protein PC121_g10848 [Phytophthora cactorum]|nr:hypothetical protein PC121_g10848 [Phytophthora cactorum]
MVLLFHVVLRVLDSRLGFHSGYLHPGRQSLSAALSTKQFWKTPNSIVSQAQSALDSNHSASGTPLAEDTESASAVSTVIAGTAALVAAVLAAGTAPVAVSEQVVGEALATDTTPVGHTAPAVEPAPAPSITPAARSADAERTAFAAQLELAAGLALVAQAATAAGSRQAVNTAPTTVLLPATEPAPAARIVATAEVGLTAGSSSLVSTALGSAAPVAPALPFSNLEFDPAPNRLVEACSADTGDHHSAQLKPGDHRP